MCPHVARPGWMPWRRCGQSSRNSVRRASVVSRDSFSADVGPVVHPFKLDRTHAGIYVANGGRKIGAGSGHAEYSPTGGFQSVRAFPSSCMKHRGASRLGSLDAADLLTNIVIARISAGSQHDADARTGPPL